MMRFRFSLDGVDDMVHTFPLVIPPAMAVAAPAGSHSSPAPGGPAPEQFPAS